MSQSKVCGNCIYCVYDRCEKEDKNGNKRMLYVGHNNTVSGCNDCFTEEDWNNEIPKD